MRREETGKIKRTPVRPQKASDGLKLVPKSGRGILLGWKETAYEERQEKSFFKQSRQLEEPVVDAVE